MSRCVQPVPRPCYGHLNISIGAVHYKIFYRKRFIIGHFTTLRQQSATIRVKVERSYLLLPRSRIARYVCPADDVGLDMDWHPGFV